MIKNSYILQYLIVGTGRCGTVYMSRLLTSLNIMCGHESVFNYRGLSYAKSVLSGIQPCELSWVSQNDLRTKKKDNSWFNSKIIVADSSLYSAPFLNDKSIQKTKIIHLVRNPIKVVSSFVLNSNIFNNSLLNESKYKKFIFDQIPELIGIKNPIERALFYFNVWNKKIIKSNRSLLLHQVESGLNDKLCAFLKIERTNGYFNDVTINTWKKNDKNLTLSELPDGSLKQEFLDLCEIFGYHM